MSEPISDITTIRQLGSVPQGGIKEEYVLKWLKRFQALPGCENQPDFNLTSLQQKAVAHPKFFGAVGPNLMVTGPTSAGKTIVAEILMANHFTRGRYPQGVIYTVPLRALATEKYNHFKSIFGPTGVYVSSSDYQEYDQLILNTRFRVVVVIYEKLFSWLTEPQYAGNLLNKTALIVADELQMLAEPQRGAKLELILTFVRDFQSRQPRYSLREYPVRIVGMGSSDTALQNVTSWLDADSIKIDETERPVPLVEGYVRVDGSYHLEPLPQRLVDTLPGGKIDLPPAAGRDANRLTQDFIVKTLTDEDGERIPIGSGKRILVYCASKNTAEAMARNIAAALGRRFPLKEETLRILEELEGTGTLDVLRELIPRGVGFHHGDLNLEERELVENLFTNLDPEGDTLDVIVSTPTLSMGVNLPADYMLFSTAETYRRADGLLHSVHERLITPLEYKNFAGRAGRLRPNQPASQHGIALFMTNRSQEEADQELLEGLIRHPPEPLEPALHRWPYGLDPLALACLAWQSTYRTTQNLAPEQIKDFFQGTFAGFSRVSVNYQGVYLPIQEAAVEILKSLSSRHPELVGNREQRFQLNSTGQSVASQGVDTLTYEILQNISQRLPEILDQPFVLLEYLVQGREISSEYPTWIPRGGEATRLAYDLRAFFQQQADAQHSLGPIASNLLATSYTPSDDELRYLIRVVAAYLWIEGAGARELLSNPLLPKIRYGAVSSLTDQLAWLVGALRPIWAGLGWQPGAGSIPVEKRKDWADEVEWIIARFERRLRYGVPDVLTSISHLRVKGGNRQKLVELWEALGGWSHPVYLLDVRAHKVPRHLRQVLDNLKRKIRRRAWADDRRSQFDKQVSFVNQAVDLLPPTEIDPNWPLMIHTLQFSEGESLIRAICDALNARPIEMDCRPGTEYGGFETGLLPEAVLAFPGPRYVGLVLVGEAGQPVEWPQIFQAINRMAPNRRKLNAIICLALGELSDSVKDDMRGDDRSILLLTRESFIQLCARATYTEDEPEQLERIKQFFEQPNEMLRGAGDVDVLLDRLSAAPRTRGQLVGRGYIARSEEQDRPYSASLKRQQPSELPGRTLLYSGLVYLQNLVDEMPQETREQNDIVFWIREVIDHILDHPDWAVARAGLILELMLRNYQEQTEKAQPWDLNNLITNLAKSGRLPSIIAKHAHTVRAMRNEADHPGWISLEVDGRRIWVPPDLSPEDALSAMPSLIRVASWYLEACAPPKP